MLHSVKVRVVRRDILTINIAMSGIYSVVFYVMQKIIMIMVKLCSNHVMLPCSTLISMLPDKQLVQGNCSHCHAVTCLLVGRILCSGLFQPHSSSPMALSAYRILGWIQATGIFTVVFNISLLEKSPLLRAFLLKL